MPHPAIDDVLNLESPVVYSYYRPGEGWQGNWTNYWPSGSGRYRRQASTANPWVNGKYVGLQPWHASGGRSETSTVTCIHRPYGSDVYKDRWIGPPTPAIYPASQLGKIPVVDPYLTGAAMRGALAQFTERTVQLEAAAKELRGTMKMVGDLASGMARTLDDLCDSRTRRGLPAKGLRSWKKLPGWYLQWLYGWKPMADDLSNAFDRLIDLRLAGEEFILTLRKKLTARSTDLVETTVFNGNPIARITFERNQTSRAVMYFKLPDWYFDELPTVAPFGTLWETAPYSFVIDWFLPVGQWIGAVESAQLWPFFIGGTVSTRLDRKVLDYRIIGARIGDIEGGSIRVSGSHREYRYERSVVDSMASGILFAKPDLRNPLSLSHAAQGLALLTQVFQKWA